MIQQVLVLLLGTATVGAAIHVELRTHLQMTARRRGPIMF